MENDEIGAFIEKYQPYFYEVRIHLIITVILFVIGCVVGLFFSQNILGFLLSLFHFDGIHIVTTSPYQFIDISLTISFILGVIFATPYAVFRLYHFVRPALRTHERRFILAFFPLAIGLFAAGFYFGLWIMQLVINLYVHINSSFSISSFWDVQHFLSQILFTSFLTGIVFEIPIVISALIRLHIFSYHDFAKRRKVVYAILVVVAILLPTTDFLSLVLETLPLFFLFELGLLLNR